MNYDFESCQKKLCFPITTQNIVQRNSPEIQLESFRTSFNSDLLSFNLYMLGPIKNEVMKENNSMIKK